MESKKIILLLNSSRIGDKIEQAFYRANFDVIRVDDNERVTNLLKKESPHALVVDWDLANGLMDEINHLMRESYRKTAFVLLSKSKGAEDRIHALENGADDCISQIPEVDELVAKVKALVRRIDMVNNIPRDIKIKDININLDTHEVRKAGKLLDLTYTQFKLLYLLASRREYVFSRDEILEKVWGENAYVTDRTVDVHVKRLREKLGEGRHPSKYIQTIHGMGYRFA
jgi:DNA-binding response OmpR family regulator